MTKAEEVAKIVTRLADTRRAAERAAAANPRNPQAHYAVGYAWNLTGAHAAALQYMKKATEGAPGNAEYWHGLGETSEFVGDFAGAMAAFRRAIAVAPYNHRSYLALVRLERQTADNNCVAALESFFSRPDPDGLATLHAGHALAKTYEDFGDLERSFHWLLKGKEIRGRLRPYSRAVADAQAEAGIGLFDGMADTASGHLSAEPIFVVGLPRSGTTLTDRILSSHPAVASAGELSNFPLLAKRISGSNSSQPMDAEALTAARNLDFAWLGRAYVDSTRPLTGKTPRFVDKAPINYLVAGLIHRALPNAKIICLRRDPMDSCLGNFRQIYPTHTRYYDYVYTLANTARNYVTFDRVAKHWSKVLPSDRYMELSYEQLVSDNVEQTRRLLEFCDLPWDDRCLSFHENESAVATPSAIQVREGLNAKGIGRWRRYGALLDPARDVLDRAGLLPPEAAMAKA